MKAYIVVYDDNESLCFPQNWDDECAGAICSDNTRPVALFQTRPEAQRAINISSRWAELNKAQGNAHNADFIDFRKHLHIRECQTHEDYTKSRKGKRK
jgi:hypothetical protein